MSDDREVYAGILDAVERGEAMVMATVVRVRGSTPRDVGSKMLIGADGTQLGTIGGGCGEADVVQAAREVLETGLPRVVRVDLTDDYLSWSPAVCGGVMEIFVERLRGLESSTRARPRRSPR